MRSFKQVGWRHLYAICLLVVAIFPILFILSASLNPTGSLSDTNGLFQSISGANYEKLFNDPQNPYLDWFINTQVIAISTAVVSTFLSALAAYAFSRFRFRGRRVGLTSLLLLQMFPQFLAFIAIFLLLNSMSEVFTSIGLGTRLGLSLVYMGGALGVSTWLIKGFFDTVPRDLDEAAKIDGASHVQTFFRIILPLVTPILAVVALLSYVATTNELLLALILLGDEPSNQTLSVGLYGFVSEQFSKNWGVFAAGAVLGAIPMILLFQFLQRFIVGGLTAGATKG
jgi:arabinogalactan oligomer / maltooligosaccharide transport system permease protein